MIYRWCPVSSTKEFESTSHELARVFDPSESAQPLLDHDEAKQKLVVILPAGPVIAQNISDRIGVEQLIHEGVIVREAVPKAALVLRSETIRPPHSRQSRASSV